jgi:hypothetical protein
MLGAKNIGRLDYLLRRQSKNPWEGPFNGQSFRQRIYSDIMDRGNFKAIVETGTFRGTTTEFFARAGLPVYSVEIDLREHGFASQRLSHLRDRVHLFHGNSPEFLQSLARNSAFPKSNVFFYLDAHVQSAQVYHEAPVVEELEIIFTNWTEAVVMIDDFEVPGTAYSHIDYGPGRVLNLAYLEPVNYLRLFAFFPVLGPEEETGAKRGWVVLCREDAINKILSGIRNLTRVLTKPAG